MHFVLLALRAACGDEGSNQREVRTDISATQVFRGNLTAQCRSQGEAQGDYYLLKMVDSFLQKPIPGLFPLIPCLMRTAGCTANGFRLLVG